MYITNIFPSLLLLLFLACCPISAPNWNERIHSSTTTPTTGGYAGAVGGYAATLGGFLLNTFKNITTNPTTAAPQAPPVRRQGGGPAGEEDNWDDSDSEADSTLDYGDNPKTRRFMLKNIVETFADRESPAFNDVARKVNAGTFNLGKAAPFVPAHPVLSPVTADYVDARGAFNYPAMFGMKAANPPPLGPVGNRMASPFQRPEDLQQVHYAPDGSAIPGVAPLTDVLRSGAEDHLAHLLNGNRSQQGFPVDLHHPVPKPVVDIPVMNNAAGLQNSSSNPDTHNPSSGYPSATSSPKTMSARPASGSQGQTTDQSRHPLQVQTSPSSDLHSPVSTPSNQDGQSPLDTPDPARKVSFLPDPYRSGSIARPVAIPDHDPGKFFWNQPGEDQAASSNTFGRTNPANSLANTFGLGSRHLNPPQPARTRTDWTSTYGGLGGAKSPQTVLPPARTPQTPSKPGQFGQTPSIKDYTGFRLAQDPPQRPEAPKNAAGRLFGPPPTTEPKPTFGQQFANVAASLDPRKITFHNPFAQSSSGAAQTNPTPNYVQPPPPNNSSYFPNFFGNKNSAPPPQTQNPQVLQPAPVKDRRYFANPFVKGPQSSANHPLPTQPSNTQPNGNAGLDFYMNSARQWWSGAGRPKEPDHPATTEKAPHNTNGRSGFGSFFPQAKPSTGFTPAAPVPAASGPPPQTNNGWGWANWRNRGATGNGGVEQEKTGEYRNPLQGMV